MGCFFLNETDIVLNFHNIAIKNVTSGKFMTGQPTERQFVEMEPCQ